MSRNPLPGSFIEPTVKKPAILCPECGSDEVALNWIEAYGIDTEKGVCVDCDHEWNECARERYG